MSRVTTLLGCTAAVAALAALAAPCRADQVGVTPNQAAEIVRVLTPPSQGAPAPIDDVQRTVRGADGKEASVRGADLSVDALVSFAYDVDALKLVTAAWQSKRAAALAALPPGARAWMDAQADLARPGLPEDRRRQLAAVALSDADRAAVERASTELAELADRPVSVDLRRVRLADLNLQANHEAVSTVAALMPLVSDAPQPPADAAKK